MNADQIAAKLTEADMAKLLSHNIWRGCHPVTWPETLTNPCCTAAAWPLLEEEAALALELIVSGFGALPFTEEQVLRAARPGIAGAALRLGLLRLADAGIIFTVRRGWGEKLFVLPLDSVLPWHHTIRSIRYELRTDTDWQTDAEIEIEMKTDWGSDDPRLTHVDPYAIEAMDDDGYVPPFSIQLLHALAQMNNAGLKLTSKQVLTKRTIAKGAGQLYMQDEALSALITPSPGPAAEAYPPALLFVLELALESGWLQEHNGSLELAADPWSAWLEQAPTVREAALLRQLTAVVCAQNAAAAAGAAVLSSLAPNTWYRIADIEAVCLDGQRLLARAHAPMIEVWCRLLKQMGWIEQGADSEGNPVIQWRIDPRPFKREEDPHENMSESDWNAVQLTPDGDLYVRERCSYSIRWQLETVADRRKIDYTTVYRMDADSYKRAAKAGFTRDSLAAYLEELTQEQLPDTVRAMIAGGMDEHEQGKIQAQADETTGKKSAVGSSDASRANLYFQNTDGGAYELLQDRMTVKLLFAGVDDIPSMWLKQFRTYHLSTRREMMEQALSWRTTVKLNCEGAITLFIPERIVEEDNRWAVSGYLQLNQHSQGAVKLYPNMWEEMMLVLPVPIGG
ncbi:hypothetical protein GZH47_28715 [Paenibacillus rhizovicinus]|uniref:Helicase XPB/Ssl2 N-terminal domain-containing protein n=1 Tax=Paenibacillus rhizovicinus TaxID=2704463 RepID=A0A6C0P769_9BACL|nr:helicase-associated domain-containing protein [Paenibacillus rhizovicinus]QHW34384.1 hypothetical protein GZH47_28715 [Paenibacillus rhizovicinus]